MSWSVTGRRWGWLPVGLLITSLVITTLHAVVASALPPPSVLATWQPDGSQVAVLLSTEQRRRILIYDRQGHRVAKHTLPEGRFSQPAWQPDGRRIWLACREGETKSGIHVLSVGTGQVSRVTDGFGPVPSPDGRRVAFVRREQDPAGDPTLQVWVSDSSGGSPRRVSLIGKEFVSGCLAWCPTGRALAYTEIGNPSDTMGRHHLWLAHMDGRRIRVTSERRPIDDVAWSRNGRCVFWIAGEGSPLWRRAVWRYDLKSDERDLLFPYDASLGRGEVCIFPERQRAGVFDVRADDDRCELRLVDLRTGSVTTIALPEEAGPVFWDPTGSLALVAKREPLALWILSLGDKEWAKLDTGSPWRDLPE